MVQYWDPQLPESFLFGGVRERFGRRHSFSLSSSWSCPVLYSSLPMMIEIMWSYLCKSKINSLSTTLSLSLSLTSSSFLRMLSLANCILAVTIAIFLLFHFYFFITIFHTSNTPNVSGWPKAPDSNTPKMTVSCIRIANTQRGVEWTASQCQWNEWMIVLPSSLKRYVSALLKQTKNIFASSEFPQSLNLTHVNTLSTSSMQASSTYKGEGGHLNISLIEGWTHCRNIVIK